MFADTVCITNVCIIIIIIIKYSYIRDKSSAQNQYKSCPWHICKLQTNFRSQGQRYRSQRQQTAVRLCVPQLYNDSSLATSIWHYWQFISNRQICSKDWNTVRVSNCREKNNTSALTYRWKSSFSFCFLASSSLASCWHCCSWSSRRSFSLLSRSLSRSACLFTSCATITY